MFTGVARWPGQESAVYEEKVPSVLIYDAEGKLIACGAEAASREKEFEAEENEWSYVENFKMHLHTATILQKNNLPLKELPPNVDLLKVYSDFLRYLCCHTRNYLRETFIPDPWAELGDQVELILTHPNGWNVIQQRFLQKAVVAAELIPANAVKTRLHFLEESEASTSFCMAVHTELADNIQVGCRFIVCDGGGSTADISAYEVKTTLPNGMLLAEIDLPSCIDGGGARVGENFKTYLWNRLTNCPEIDQEEALDILSDGHHDFERHCKRAFTSPGTSYTVAIGGRRMNVSALQVTKGVLTLHGPTVEQFFMPSVDAIVADIQRRLANQTIEFIILTGGFGESPYLKAALETRLDPRTPIVIANSPNSKAVAMGGVRLFTGGPGSVTITRTKRPWKTWIANIAKVFKRSPRNQP